MANPLVLSAYNLLGGLRTNQILFHADVQHLLLHLRKVLHSNQLLVLEHLLGHVVLIKHHFAWILQVHCSVGCQNHLLVVGLWQLLLALCLTQQVFLQVRTRKLLLLAWILLQQFRDVGLGG